MGEPKEPKLAEVIQIIKQARKQAGIYTGMRKMKCVSFYNYLKILLPGHIHPCACTNKKKNIDSNSTFNSIATQMSSVKKHCNN